LCGHEAISIRKKGDAFSTAFGKSSKSTRTFVSDRVVVSAGGKASPFLGSDGSGYRLLQDLGHSLIAPAPALTQLCLAAPGIRGLKGVRVRAGIKLLSSSTSEHAAERNEYKIRYSEAGELLFTEYGVSGIPALNMSNRLAPFLDLATGPPDAKKGGAERNRKRSGAGNVDIAYKNGENVQISNGGAINAARKAGGKTVGGAIFRINGQLRTRYVISIDLFPHFSHSELTGFILKQLNKRPAAPYDEILCGIAHKNIAALIIKYAQMGNDSDKQSRDSSSNRGSGSGCYSDSGSSSGSGSGCYNGIGRDPANNGAAAARLSSAMKDWRLVPIGVKGFENAQCTYGGMSFDDFYIDTLESKIVKGLFAAGEILDTAGDCGGYNLHWAWLSGFIAGTGAAGGAL
jgi:predicted flavoprotein YhiN